MTGYRCSSKPSENLVFYVPVLNSHMVQHHSFSECSMECFGYGVTATSHAPASRFDSEPAGSVIAVSTDKADLKQRCRCTSICSSSCYGRSSCRCTRCCSHIALTRSQAAGQTTTAAGIVTTAAGQVAAAVNEATTAADQAAGVCSGITSISSVCWAQPCCFGPRAGTAALRQTCTAAVHTGTTSQPWTSSAQACSVCGGS